jgi:nucleotide-binding universal stress UspA family protein
MYKRILIVIDSQPEAETALHRGIAMARRHDAEVLFFSVLPRYGVPVVDVPPFAMLLPHDQQDETRAQAQRLLSEAVAWAEHEGVMSRTAMGSGEDDARCIVDAARHGRCDLIVVACDTGNAVQRLLTGSVVPGLVTASPLPVLVCKSATRAGTTQMVTSRSGAAPPRKSPANRVGPSHAAQQHGKDAM